MATAPPGHRLTPAAGSVAAAAGLAVACHASRPSARALVPLGLACAIGLALGIAVRVPLVVVLAVGGLATMAVLVDVGRPVGVGPATAAALTLFAVVELAWASMEATLAVPWAAGHTRRRLEDGGALAVAGAVATFLVGEAAVPGFGSGALAFAAALAAAGTLAGLGLIVFRRRTHHA